MFEVGNVSKCCISELTGPDKNSREKFEFQLPSMDIFEIIRRNNSIYMVQSKNKLLIENVSGPQ